MNTNIKHALFIALGIAALLLTWPHAFDWMEKGGNILNPIDFFGDAIAAGGTAAFLSIDMAIAWLVFMIWVVFDTKRIGMGYKWGWFFVALSYFGVSMAFPFYLVARERFLDRQASQG
jgi:Terpene cyclase DEP1